MDELVGLVLGLLFDAVVAVANAIWVFVGMMVETLATCCGWAASAKTDAERAEIDPTDPGNT